MKCGMLKQNCMNYNQTKQLFLTYFKKKAKSSIIEDALEKEFHIMPDLFFSNNKSNKYKIQAFINSLYLKDIKNIIEISETRNIFLVFMKGIFYAADLYTDYNCRVTNDLDVLTRKEDLHKLDNCLRSLGYEYKGKQDLIQESEIGHLKYVKPIGTFGMLLIEVHISICNPAKYYKGYTELVVKNADYQELLGLKPKMESPQDRIIHSCIHFFNHTKDRYAYKLLKLSPIIKWQTLFDIVLLINKYGIDDKYMYQIVKRYNCSLDLFFSFKIINEIIPNYISEKILLQLKSFGLGSELLENVIEKKFLMASIENETQNDKVLTSTLFNYDKVLVLSCFYQNAVSYRGEDFAVDIDLKMTEKEFSFLVDFENVDLSEISLVVHYTTINKETNDIALEKIICSFKKDNDTLLPMVKMPYNHNYCGDIRSSRTIKNGNRVYQFSADKEKLVEAIKQSPNNILSYSVYVEGKNICVSGLSWLDFNTMKHIKVD